MTKSFWGTQTPIAIAHRGGAGLFSLDRYHHENTLNIFKAAVEHGYDYLELDVTNTADNYVVVLHVTADRFEALLRKPSAPDARKLQQYSYSELKKRLGRQIPTLQDVLRAFPRTKFLIDAKTDEVVEPLAEIVIKTKTIGRVYLNSFFVHRIIRLQQLLGPDLNCGVIIGRHPRPFNRRIQALNRGEYFNKGFSAITFPQRFLTRRKVDLTHRHGLKVMVWTPNTEPKIQKAIDLEVNGIISDNIILLKKILESRKANVRKSTN
jgi:glycerophosphoryl diester phosphodiesterase